MRILFRSLINAFKTVRWTTCQHSSNLVLLSFCLLHPTLNPQTFTNNVFFGVLTDASTHRQTTMYTFLLNQQIPPTTLPVLSAFFVKPQRNFSLADSLLSVVPLVHICFN